MTHDRKTLEQIDQITDKAADRLSDYAAQRLADLRHVLVAGGMLTTVERIEVSEMWDKHVK